jgi:hypothetical protein
MVHVVKYFVPKGMTGMKNRVKNRLLLVRACAAGVWQCAHITNMVASRDDFRRNPNKMIISLPHFALRLIGSKNGERNTTPPQQRRVNTFPIVSDPPPTQVSEPEIPAPPDLLRWRHGLVPQTQAGSEAACAGAQGAGVGESDGRKHGAEP